MTAVLTEPVALQVTPEQYEAMPPNSRIELVDGMLRVMATPTSQHQEVVDNLKGALRRLCPSDMRPVREQELRLAPNLRRNPDLMVVGRFAVRGDGSSYDPKEVLLVVEVESPGNLITDRLHKPAEYALAGIPYYWRLATDPEIVVCTYRLSSETRYESTGDFKAGDEIEVPGLEWARVAVADLDADF